MSSKFVIDEKRVADLCRKWNVERLELFGSALRDDFGPASDIDLLVTFGAESRWSLLDLVRMENELSAALDRRVDLVDRRAVEASDNYIRRREILHSAHELYASG